MDCRYCGKDRKLIRAHILPQSFYQHMRNNNDNPIIVPGAKDDYITDSHSGEYDPNILCELCERKFDRYDRYGKTFFLDTEWEAMPRVSGDRLIEVPGADYRMLKLFILSVLLRAHWTTRPFFGIVDIGGHAESIRDMIESGDAGDSQYYCMTLFRFEPTGTDLDPKLGWRNPGRVRIDGLRFWAMWFHQFGAFVKVDQRPWSNPVAQLALDPTRPIRIITRDFRSSREFQSLLQLTRARLSVDDRRRGDPGL